MGRTLYALGVEEDNDMIIIAKKETGGKFVYPPEIKPLRLSFPLPEKPKKTLILENTRTMTKINEIKTKKTKIKGKKFVIFDDMVISGGTIISSLKLFPKNSEIYLVTIHPAFMNEDVVKKLLKNGSSIRLLIMLLTKQKNSLQARKLFGNGICSFICL